MSAFLYSLQGVHFWSLSQRARRDGSVMWATVVVRRAAAEVMRVWGSSEFLAQYARAFLLIGLNIPDLLIFETEQRKLGFAGVV